MGGEGGVEVTPDQLRSAGRTIGEIPGPFGLVDGAIGDAMMVPSSRGDRNRLSGGYFAPSAAADQHLTTATASLMRMIGQASNMFGGLASTLHIVADVYAQGDLDEALRFAWNEPGASRPPGLSPLVDADDVQSYQQTQEASEEEPRGSDPYRGDFAEAKPMSREILGDGYEVKKFYDEDGNVAREEHWFENPDGSSDVYTYEGNERSPSSVELASPSPDTAVQELVEDQYRSLEGDFANLPEWLQPE